MHIVDVNLDIYTSINLGSDLSICRALNRAGLIILCAFSMLLPQRLRIKRKKGKVVPVLN
jgi:hypothetical protein